MTSARSATALLREPASKSGGLSTPAIVPEGSARRRRFSNHGDAESADRLQGILSSPARDWLKGVAGLPGVAVRLIVGIPDCPAVLDNQAIARCRSPSRCWPR